jgi:hypothetical protein
MQVGAARKKFDVQYPHMYAPTGHKNETAFNQVATLPVCNFVLHQVFQKSFAKVNSHTNSSTDSLY